MFKGKEIKFRRNKNGLKEITERLKRKITMEKGQVKKKVGKKIKKMVGKQIKISATIYTLKINGLS